MKIFTSAQIHELDKYTIEHEPITSINLMERAARTITRAIVDLWDASMNVVVFAGPGNNGGDALAVARMLSEKNYHVTAYLFNINNKLSNDCAVNHKRLKECKKVKEYIEVNDEFDPPKLDAKTLVVDGLFGTGLNKPLAGGFASLVKYINQSTAKKVSIDIPSGLMTEDNTYNVQSNIIKADVTLTLQHKKLAFMFPENQQYIGRLEVLDINLSEEGIRQANTQYIILDNKTIPEIRKRDDFSHKGDMGNALIIAGSYGMAGAAILATKACLRSGVGKVTVHTPRRNNSIMQISVPEAIVDIDNDDNYFTSTVSTELFDSVAIGPGINKQENSAIALISQISRTQVPIVLDADALNILSTHRAWLQQLPKHTIITPHPKEFDRIAGTNSTNSYERLSKARDMAERLQIYIILKGHYSALCTPEGNVVFNSTGNAGMATAGSGDVLTGIIVALLARGYSQYDACALGVYIHGLAGDIAAEEKGVESLMASDIVDKIATAILLVTSNRFDK